MKSSTIRRSALSKESMDVLENLSSEEFVDYTESNDENMAPDEYIRPDATNKNEQNKYQEIDLLWQTFKGAQFNTNSPWIQVVGGFLLGLFVAFLILSAFLVYSANKSGNIINSKQILINFSQPQPTIETENLTQQQAVENIDDVSEDEVTEQSTEQEQNNKISEQTESSESFDYTKVKKYTIQDGDTVERIIKKYYGSYSVERAEAIMKANNLKNLDHISIGQVLIIPAEK